MPKKNGFKKSSRAKKIEKKYMMNFRLSYPNTWNKLRDIRNAERNLTPEDLREIFEDGIFASIQSVRACWSKFSRITRFEKAPTNPEHEEKRKEQQNYLMKTFAKLDANGCEPDFRKLAIKTKISMRHIMTYYKRFSREPKAENVPNLLSVESDNDSNGSSEICSEQDSKEEINCEDEDVIFLGVVNGNARGVVNGNAVCCVPMHNDGTDCYGISAVNLIHSIEVIRERIKLFASQGRREDRWQVVNSLGDVFNRKERLFRNTREALGMADEINDASSAVEKILLNLQETGIPIPEISFEYQMRKVCENGCPRQPKGISTPFNRLVLRKNETLRNLQHSWESDGWNGTCRKIRRNSRGEQMSCGEQMQVTKEARTDTVGDYHVMLIDHVEAELGFVNSKANDIVTMFEREWRLIAFSEHFRGGMGHYVSWLRIHQNVDTSNWILLNDDTPTEHSGSTLRLDNRTINVLVFKKI